LVEEPRSMIDRAFALLDCFRTSPELSLGQLAVKTCLPKTTVHRIVTQLISQHTLERTEDGQYRLGLRLFELGESASARALLRNESVPFLQDFCKATSQTANLVILDGTSGLYLERITGHDAHLVGSRSGGRMPLYCTGVGKALLANAERSLVTQVIAEGLTARTTTTITDPYKLKQDLGRVLSTGVAIDDEESFPGVTCFGVPIKLGGGKLIGAVSVSGPADMIGVTGLRKFVVETASQLSRHLTLLARSGHQVDPAGRAAG
jgi:IclR family acetate operon transcriptional repressor